MKSPDHKSAAAMESEGKKVIKHEENHSAPRSSSNSDYNSTPSSNFSFEAPDSLSMDFKHSLPRSWFEFQCQHIQKKHQEMLLLYNSCFTCLQKAFSEVNLLQGENLKLRAENIDLCILVSTKENEIMSSSISGLKNASDSHQIDPCALRNVSEMFAGKQNTQSLRKVSLPKVISIRSSALNNNQPVVGPSCSKRVVSSTGPNPPFCLRLTAAAAKSPQSGDEVEGIELEVCNQGMAKTELCNKWEETGCCPYGDRCQFAHGIEELRPVIRHPRYKTEVCRMMFNSGGTCPYGHRCHFRHSLDPRAEEEVVL